MGRRMSATARRLSVGAIHTVKKGCCARKAKIQLNTSNLTMLHPSLQKGIQQVRDDATRDPAGTLQSFHSPVCALSSAFAGQESQENGTRPPEEGSRDESCLQVSVALLLLLLWNPVLQKELLVLSPEPSALWTRLPLQTELLLHVLVAPHRPQCHSTSAASMSSSQGVSSTCPCGRI